MKRMFSMFVIFVCLLLTGCSDRSENIHIRGRSNFTDTSTDIRIDKKYTLKDYKKEYTENWCTIIIYYEIYAENDK